MSSALITEALSALAPGARTYFTTHLEHEPGTRQVIDLIVCMAELATQPTSRAALVLAMQGAMLHRAGGDQVEPEALDPSTLPFALELELERVLMAWPRAEAVRRQCIDRDERAAAAILALAHAWSQHRGGPAWVWDHLADVGLSESDLATLLRQLDP